MVFSKRPLKGLWCDYLFIITSLLLFIPEIKDYRLGKCLASPKFPRGLEYTLRALYVAIISLSPDFRLLVEPFSLFLAKHMFRTRETWLRITQSLMLLPCRWLLTTVLTYIAIHQVVIKALRVSPQFESLALGPKSQH